MADVKIKKIEIKIDKKTISLSYKQAKELKGALDNLFQQPYVWYYPVCPQTFQQPNYTEWTYTTNNTKDDGIISLNIKGG